VSGVSPILPVVGDVSLPLPIPDVVTALAEAQDRRHAAGQRPGVNPMPTTVPVDPTSSAATLPETAPWWLVPPPEWIHER
jgi:hypothetical protein